MNNYCKNEQKRQKQIDTFIVFMKVYQRYQYDNSRGNDLTPELVSFKLFKN